MTAYSRSSVQSDVADITCEIQSVNRKFLDIQLQMPSELTQFDIDIRKLLSKQLYRGRIQVKVYVRYEKRTPYSVKPNIGLATEIKNSWDQIAKELGMESVKGFKLDMLQASDVLNFEVSSSNKEKLFHELKALILDVLNQFTEMKKVEGQALAEDISFCLKAISQNVHDIGNLSKNSPKKYQEKLLKRIQDNLGLNLIEDERIIKEVALFADRVDISEEITRLKSHIEQFQKKMKDQGPHGKTLEFIVQEMFRETNTIGSKTEEIEVKQCVLAIKSELEKIKEQIQNVE